MNLHYVSLNCHFCAIFFSLKSSKPPKLKYEQSYEIKTRLNEARGVTLEWCRTESEHPCADSARLLGLWDGHA